jgi:hypothetical protein
MFGLGDLSNDKSSIAFLISYSEKGNPKATRSSMGGSITSQLKSWGGCAEYLF